MIVVTISKWRQKFVWLLAVILVATVFLGQFLVGGGPGRQVDTDRMFLQQQEGPAATASMQETGRLESLLEKLRSFYRGE